VLVVVLGLGMKNSDVFVGQAASQWEFEEGNSHSPILLLVAQAKLALLL
jgi:hypothetical protein